MTLNCDLGQPNPFPSLRPIEEIASYLHKLTNTARPSSSIGDLFKEEGIDPAIAPRCEFHSKMPKNMRCTLANAQHMAHVIKYVHCWRRLWRALVSLVFHRKLAIDINVYPKLQQRSAMAPPSAAPPVGPFGAGTMPNMGNMPMTNMMGGNMMRNAPNMPPMNTPFGGMPVMGNVPNNPNMGGRPFGRSM